jgi:hypothetical protein
MTAHKAMIAACVSFSLVLGALIYSAVRGKSIKLEHAKELRLSHSDLEQDEMTLIADMRQLRRDLRRRVNRLQIAQERDEIRQDWFNIVDDRGLKRNAFSPAGELPSQSLVLSRGTSKDRRLSSRAQRSSLREQTAAWRP